ncbi:hypothetical protein HOL21_00655 [Candidatus Woesearchaeota archaeon]|jgi:ribonuclease P/MRP protein subunit POP5|nr:hypothetical protein [Candidatus Woesearchaeota archaeon]MBT5396706.1 hypothetical protein [Candidatus Woesearchaeota archaeon]MBT5924322.1 hypothetical protein [Candidatus Woesearchaeota archaeon]MBT6367507.1 hypothetical protein [Candidatus Woesearchaeota archaeon]MBT7763006.1 hypothetical protein [Candidatus Woesearchaeota archaeon]
MKLLPSLRQKKRYIVWKIVSDKDFTVQDIQSAVESALTSFLGQLGLAKASPLFLKEKCNNKTFIIKVNHKYVDECKSAIILIKKIKNMPVLLTSVTTSGTLKKACSFVK